MMQRREILRAATATACLPAFPSLLMADDPYADAVLVDGVPPKRQDGAFCIAVLPDTQHYSQNFPATFEAQTKWLVENRESRNIAFVVHLGDITNNSTDAEWENAKRAMSLLNGQLPYSIVPGNHDYSEKGGCTDRSTKVSKYFPVSNWKDMKTFGGTFVEEPDKIENSFHLFEAGGIKFLVLALEFGPRREVVQWAKKVIGDHADRFVILTTHAYMYYDDSRYDWSKLGDKQSWNPHAYGVAKATAGNVMDGQELWDELVRGHERFMMTLNGHVLQDGLGKLTSVNAHGRDVHQILVNFQMRPKGGDGWLRLLEFQPGSNSIQTYDYSPTRNQHNTSPQNQFSLKLSV